MRIDKRLHLIVPIYEDDPVDPAKPKIIANVHSTPLSVDVVDRYFEPLGKAYNKIFTGGYGIVSGPGHAMRILKQAAVSAGVWEGADGVENGLVEEIRRLTMVMVPNGPNGWQSLPIAVAAQQGMISDEDRREVENAVVFFIVVCATLPRSERRAAMESAAGLWNAQISFLNSTDFANSLRTSIGTVSSGEKSPAPVAAAPVSANAVVDGKLSSVPH